MDANLLVKGINIAVIGVIAPLKKQYPVLTSVLNKSKHPLNDWDFFMTVAGVGLYLLRDKVSDEKKEQILKQLAELDKQMPEGIDNFMEFVEKDKDMDIRITVGFWVLWNIGGEAPTHDESKELAPVIGNYLLNVIKDFES